MLVRAIRVRVTDPNIASFPSLRSRSQDLKGLFALLSLFFNEYAFNRDARCLANEKGSTAVIITRKTLSVEQEGEKKREKTRYQCRWLKVLKLH